VALKTRNPESGVQILSRQDAANVKVFGRVRWRGGIV
jgi:hypothetical protein